MIEIQPSNKEILRKFLNSQPAITNPTDQDLDKLLKQLNHVFVDAKKISIESYGRQDTFNITRYLKEFGFKVKTIKRSETIESDADGHTISNNYIEIVEGTK